jgi:hypothetical protein
MYYESSEKRSNQTGLITILNGNGIAISVSHNVHAITAQAIIILTGLVTVPVLSLLVAAR